MQKKFNVREVKYGKRNYDAHETVTGRTYKGKRILKSGQ